MEDNAALRPRHPGRRRIFPAITQLAMQNHTHHVSNHRVAPRPSRARFHQGCCSCYRVRALSASKVCGEGGEVDGAADKDDGIDGFDIVGPFDIVAEAYLEVACLGCNLFFFFFFFFYQNHYCGLDSESLTKPVRVVNTEPVRLLEYSQQIGLVLARRIRLTILTILRLDHDRIVVEQIATVGMELSPGQEAQNGSM